MSWEGAAGSRLATLQVANTTARPYLLAAISTVALVDATDRALLEAESAAGGGPIELAPGADVAAEVSASNYCGPAAASPISIRLGLAGGEAVAAAPAPGEFEGLAVPPCLGEEPGTMEVRPWSSP